MNYIVIIIFVGLFLFTDVYLGLKIKNIIDSKKRRITKLALIGANSLLAIIAILITITIFY